MRALGVILARAGSKGLPNKCMRPLLGRALIEYTFDHALASERLGAVLLSTDCAPAAALAAARGIELVQRPAELASDQARVDDAVRHALRAWEARHAQTADYVAILYGNIPLRAAGLIDRVLAHLEQSGATSVRTLAPVSKQHPDWLHRLEDGDRMRPLRANSIHRRQDLEPLYYHDGAMIAVTRAALLESDGAADPHAFFGADRRGLVQAAHESVDIDTMFDLHLAQALLQARWEPAA